MRCPFVIKVCNECKKILVANNYNFRNKKGGKYGLGAVCKECCNKQNKQYNKKNKDEINRKNRERYHDNIEFERARGKIKYEKNKEKINAELREKYKNDENFRNKKKIQNHNSYINHQEKVKQRHKEYYYKNKDYYIKYHKIWRINNPDKVFNSAHKRREALKNQGSGITKEQWKEMFDFFEWKCAYSDEYLGGDNINRTIDHIIPIDNNGEHEIWNLVPMHKSYNSSKNNKNMEEWYKQQEFYLEERLNKIYEWCKYAKNKWGE